ncbi:MAG: GntR family transcriptional regulator [Spirochaetales bacterium]|nr:GntR family transcriptional regulator [Spirochaetales bacterium]
MSGRIDKSSGIPYYIQAERLLLDRIKANEFPDGRLPSESELAETYEITVTTVRKVLAELQRNNQIYKVKGLGSFIKKPKLELDIAKYLSFGRIIREKGLAERIEVISREVKPFDAALLDGFEVHNPSKRIINIDRIRYIEEEPLAIERLYFNDDLCGPMYRKAADGLIYDFLVTELGINFAHIDEYLEPICLSAEDGRLLGVKNHSPALLITKVSYDQRGAWLEYSHTTIRGDKCRYHVSLK